VSALHVLVDDADAAGVLARRAGYVRTPPEVLRVDGRTLVPAPAAAFVPAPPLPAEVAALRPLIEAGGAEAVEEHGVLVGEVRGLEVCRAVVDADTGEPRLEVGVGAHDREAFGLLHGDVPTVEALAGVVARIAAVRAPDAEPHPLNRLAAERLLRWRVEDEPGLVGCASLRSAPPPVPRTSLKVPVPCVASGESLDGRTAVVVCAAGVDLDHVPFAADARAYLGDPAARLVLVVAAGSDAPITTELTGLLTEPAEVVALP
jgi:hypothetical protein